MNFPTVKPANEWDDSEYASDIVSELEEDINYVGDVNFVGSFSKHDDEENENASGWNDPWSSDAWNDVPWEYGAGGAASTTPNRRNQKLVDTSFESLQFGPLVKTTGEEKEFRDLDIADAFGEPFGPASNPSIAAADNHSSQTTTKRLNSQGSSHGDLLKGCIICVNIIVKERLSIVFDDASKEPICRVVGSIYVKPTKRNISSFCLTVRDKRSHVEHWDERNSRCRNITAAVPHLALDPGDQVFSISLNRERQQDSGLDAPIATYTCTPRLRPMPILLKTKIHKNNNRCRIGTRIRANPQNNYHLKDVVILIIVPVELDGENVTMSRQGGVWDEMKRTLIWTIPSLEPGEIVDIQAQFKNTTKKGLSQSDSSDRATIDYGDSGNRSLKFPVLVRCNGDTNFSKIDADTNYNECGSTPIELEVERLATVLYRNV